MMALHTLVPVISLGLLLIWKPVHSLDRNGENVCSTIKSASERYVAQSSYQSSYTSSCGFLWLNRCRRYRTRYRYVARYRTVYSRDYVCCDGYAAPPGSNECSEPICAPACMNGRCGGPNLCVCDEQFHGPTCEYNCNLEISNCETVDCTNAMDSVCIKCLYDISEEIKAYDLVDGVCQKRCSWRSKSCYPGTCTSLQGVPSCACANRFQSDPNCMRITEAPTVSHCSVLLQNDDVSNGISTSDFSCQDLQGSPSPIYSSLRGNGLSVNWQTRFTGPSSATYPFPYYVNDFRVGVISAAVNWIILRGGDAVANGSIDCKLNHNKDDPNLSSHSCTRYGRLTEPLQHSDKSLNVYKMTKYQFVLHVHYPMSLTNTCRVYCAVLGVNDTAKNTRYARRCFIFDDQSEISIVNDKPIELVVDGEKLNLLESDVWTTGDKNVRLNNGMKNPVAMAMEFAPNADLSKYLQQSRDSLYDNRIDQLSSAQLCIYAQQVCSGMQHIQRHKIIHRNLGARNILVGDNKVCKITDFGRAVVADIDGTFVETQEIQLPVRWTAVEGLRDRLFSMNSDVWSFGVLMWEIVTLGSKPYGNMPIKKIAEDVIGGVRLTKPRHCSDAL
ncbi:uncharacterized protein LOC117112641 [Anneissia japonica]|uniref:uncharacterized protein LOC117112641 n=1 Tax=Anneissia japonica TaxID=1529436 RepID=UPI001425A995|nr:uncharacterized protein LOC117112641 [Anneissia japonica]